MNSKKKFGWEDGKCRNLSDEEGDLSELNSLIKNMLLEQFQYEQEKKVSKADNGEINICETTVLLNALGEKSKVKRRYKDANGNFVTPIASVTVGNISSADDSISRLESSSTIGSTNSKSDIQLFTEAINSLSNEKSPEKRKLFIAEEQDVEGGMKGTLNNYSVHQLLDKAYNRSSSSVIKHRFRSRCWDIN